MASLLAILQDRRKTLKAEGDALVAAAESAPDVLVALAESEPRRTAIAADLDRVDAEVTAEAARRDRIRAMPSDPESTGEAPVSITAIHPTGAPEPFASLGEQLQAVARAGLQPHAPIHPGLLAINQFAASTGASELVGSDGGFLVQTNIQNDLLTGVLSAAVLAPLADTREVGAGFNGTKFNVIDETSRVDGSRYGGVRAYWVAEGGQKTATRPKLRQVELTLQKLAGMYVSTDELLQDAVALESFVRPAFESEFAFKVDDAMIRGTGAGMPLGVLNSAALVSVAKETGQAADTVLYENFVSMLSRFSPGSIRNARWFINQGVWAQLPMLAMVIGTGGVPVFQMPTGATDAPFGMLLGRPIEVIEQAAAIGDKGDVILADWQKYLLLRKGGIVQDSSIHVYFDTDETAFRWVLRINGRPILEAPVTPFKGSATTSPFVTLDARA